MGKTIFLIKIRGENIDEGIDFDFEDSKDSENDDN